MLVFLEAIIVFALTSYLVQTLHWTTVYLPGDDIKGNKKMSVEDKWDREMKQGEQSLAANNSAAAEKHFKEALLLAKATFSPDDFRLGKSLYFIGQMRLATGGATYGDDSLFERAANILEKSSTADSKKLLIDALLGQGEMSARLGKAEESILVLERASSLATEQYGADDPKCADILYSLGTSYGVRRQFDKSVKTLEKAIDLFEKSKQYKKLSSALADLASVLQYAGRREEAEEAQDRADAVARDHGVGFSWSY